MNRFNLSKFSSMLNTSIRPRIILDINKFNVIIGASYSNELGSGSGKGGGKGGTIRDAGGAMGKKGAVHEEEYFKKMELEQLKSVKKFLEDELSSHLHEIESHTEAIERHQRRIKELKEAAKKC